MNSARSAAGHGREQHTPMPHFSQDDGANDSRTPCFGAAAAVTGALV